MLPQKYIHALVLIVVALGFRLFQVSAYGLWSDEMVAVLAATGQYPENKALGSTFTEADLSQQNTLEQVLKSTNYLESGNAILYNSSLHLWLKLLGPTEFNARLLSVIFSCLAILVLYRLAFFIFKSNTAAFICSLFFAAHPLSIEYAQQARSYSLAVLFSLLSTYFFYKTIHKSGPALILYVLFSFAALITHYLTVGILIAHGLIVLTSVRQARTWLFFGFAWLLLVVGLFIWIKTISADGMKMMAERNANFSQLAHSSAADQNTFYLPANLKNIAAGSLQVLLQVFANGLQNINLKLRELLLSLALPLSLVIITYRAQKKQNVELANQYRYLALFIITQIALSIALALQSKHCISFQPLYANFVVPYAALLLGFAITTAFSGGIKTSYQSVTSILVLGILLISLLPIYSGQNGRLPKHQKMHVLADQLKLADTVYVNKLSTAQQLHFYTAANSKRVYKIDTSLKNDSAYSHQN